MKRNRISLSAADLKTIEEKVERFRSNLLEDAYETVILAQHLGLRKTIDGVFDKYLGQAIPLPAVIGLALQSMGTAQPDYRRVQRIALEYIKLPSNRAWLSITSGKNGGVRRIKDIPKKKP